VGQVSVESKHLAVNVRQTWRWIGCILLYQLSTCSWSIWHPCVRM